MKKSIMIMVIVLIAGAAHAEMFKEWSVDVKLELNQMVQSRSATVVKEGPYAGQDELLVKEFGKRVVAFTDMYVGITWQWTDYYPLSWLWHRVYAQATTYMWQEPVYQDMQQSRESVLQGFPFRDIYTVGTRMYIGPVYLQYEHYCSHPVWTDDPYVGDQWDRNRWIYSGDTVSIGIEFQFTPDGLKVAR